MSSGRQIVRLMAAVILAIIAYVAPSTVQAHEGHAHHGHYEAAAAQTHAAPAAAETIVSTAPSHQIEAAALIRTVIEFRVLAVEPEPSLQAGDFGRGCCPGACKGSCCGTMVCCASGIVGNAASLSLPLSKTVVLIPRDVAGRVGIGPEALRKPPRTLA